MLNYDSPVATDNTLCEELNDKLSNEFEDNLVIQFSDYITDEFLEDETYAQLAQLYSEAKAAYIDALAAIIMHPDALDYVD